MLMILDTVKFVDENLLKVLSFRLFKSSCNSYKKQTRKYNLLLLSEVYWDKEYPANVVNKNICVTHPSEMCFTDFQIDIIQSGSLQEFPRRLWITDQACTQTVLIF